jgi:hypothetical protein
MSVSNQNPHLIQDDQGWYHAVMKDTDLETTQQNDEESAVADLPESSTVAIAVSPLHPLT